ncbi:MAG TPA: DUF192 domain-containing protein [Candidatus Acidoferrales bacterium]|nr:DUF192 domain-containing protein [Candidatus Acidoferrales bacterium]
MHRSLRIRLIPLALTLLLLAPPGCARGPSVSIVGADGKQRGTVSVEVADTLASRQTGLMDRNHLGDSTGMIFVFPESAPRSFWMHNTWIPLDMIFADASGRVIGIVANAEPNSDKLLGVDGDSQYVLEVNGGWCARAGVKVGDRLNFSGFSPHTSK